MKALLSLTVVAGLLISSTSNAFCLKQYSAKMNRMAASSNKTNFYNVASTSKTAANSAVQAQSARK